MPEAISSDVPTVNCTVAVSARYWAVAVTVPGSMPCSSRKSSAACGGGVRAEVAGGQGVDVAEEPRVVGRRGQLAGGFPPAAARTCSSIVVAGLSPASCCMVRWYRSVRISAFQPSQTPGPTAPRSAAVST